MTRNLTNSAAATLLLLSGAAAPAFGGSVTRPGDTIGLAATKSPVWLVLAALLQAIASDALGEAESADRSLERALDLAEPQRLLLRLR